MECMEIIQLIINGLLLLGIVVGMFQVRAARRISRANVLLRLLEEWNSKELYQSVRYIHDLRRKWKQQEPDATLWPILAEKLVSERIDAENNSTDEAKKKLAVEWFQRRLVAQFISRMGNLIKNKYISEEEFFTIVPEARYTVFS